LVNRRRASVTAVEKGQSEEAKRAVTMTVAQMDKLDKPVMPVLEGKPPAAKKAKPSKAQEEEADEVDEPELRKEEPVPPAAKKSDLASVVADWDTDD
jgi:hypothetical protein